MRRVRFTIGADEYEAEMPSPLYDAVLAVGRLGGDVDTLTPAARADLVKWATRNATPTNRVAPDEPVRWVELGNDAFTNATPITWTAQDPYPAYEYDFYEDVFYEDTDDTEDTPNATPDATGQVYGMLSGAGPTPGTTPDFDPNARVLLTGPYASPEEMLAAYRAYDPYLSRYAAGRLWTRAAPTGPTTGPAAPHLSSDTSRSAYAAAGALRDAGDARDDDLKWPDEWKWGKPAPMLGGTHEPVYAEGTEPLDSDEEFPETSSGPLPDEIDGVPVARPPVLPLCDCPLCDLRRRVTDPMGEAAAALTALRGPAEATGRALDTVRGAWDEMLAAARALRGGFVVDETIGWSFPPAGEDAVWAPATGGQSPFAGDWSERIRTAPRPLTGAADPRGCAPRVVDTPGEVRIGDGVALDGPADLRERIRNGDVIELGPDYMRVIRETITRPRSIRPQRVIP